VERIADEDGAWTVTTSKGAFRAAAVVVASGYNAVPHLPAFEGIDTFGGPVVHSSAYRTGSTYRGQRVLVVGCGNSGAEIALDLYEQGADATMVVRGPVHVIPRDLFGRGVQETSILMSRLPTWLADGINVVLLRVAVGDLSKWGIVCPHEGPRWLVEQRGKVSILDVGTIAKVKAGDILVAPGIARFSPGACTFADGRTLPFDAVVLATGFLPQVPGYIDSRERFAGARGLPRHHGADVGSEVGAPPLFFVGFRNPPTGALREMAIEAPRVAAALRDQAPK
jgi:hypothetical protein